MQIAQVINGVIGRVGEHTELFPNTSFAGDPNPEFLIENDCLLASDRKAYDPDRQRLEAVAPYLEAGKVFTVIVVELTADELAANQAAAELDLKTKRAAAYQQESDPLFFKAQRGEATMDEWLAKVAEIKARY
jgi:hypothetical protein